LPAQSKEYFTNNENFNFCFSSRQDGSQEVEESNEPTEDDNGSKGGNIQQLYQDFTVENLKTID